MKTLFKMLLAIIACFAHPALAVGLLPVPVLKDVQIRAEVRLDATRGWYYYAYVVSNPAQNTGQITRIEIDIQNPYGNRLSTDGLTISMGGNPYSYQGEYEEMKANPYWGRHLPLFVPVGLKVPPRWHGGLKVTGVVKMYPAGGHDVAIKPGSSLSGFELTSYGLPAIRDVWFTPEWVFMVADHDAVTLADREAAGQIEQNIEYQTVVLGPSGVERGSFAHWNLLRDDLARAIQLGWFPDAGLASALSTQLAAAREALETRDLYLTHQRLDVLLATISASTPAQRTSEGYGLMYFNVKAIIESTNYNTEEPKVTLSPRAAGYSLGETHTATATVVDLANGSRPMPGLRAYFYVESGPHQGDVAYAETDANGVAQASYTGTREGIDNFVVRVDYCGECSMETVETVSWAGGPDLTVPFFSPPALITAGGRNFFLSDETENVGSTASPPSVTRYYIFPNQNADPYAALPIGERAIPALQPGESSVAFNQVFVIPDTLPAGTHYLSACADAAKSVAELNEDNNCSFNTLERRTSVIHLLEPPSNQPPVCGQAEPSVAILWPPNHKLETVAIQGVTDPDNDPVAIRITGITQDEPVNGLGDGDTAPDGFGVGTSQAQVRVERSGTGNGRVYAISFVADDGKNGTCSGQVAVGVPHDMGKGRVPVDDGQSYDSTLLP